MLILLRIVDDLSSADRNRIQSPGKLGERPQTDNLSFLVSLEGRVALSILNKHTNVAIVCKLSVAARVILVSILLLSQI